MIMPFDMILFHYGYRLLLLPIILCSALWLMPTNAQADISVTCTANMNNGSVNLDEITPASADNASITGTLNYSCDNAGDTAGYISVCLAADGGADKPGNIVPRYMISASGDKLAFNMKLPGGIIWGDRRQNKGTEYSSEPIYILAGQKNISRQVPITVSLIPGEKNGQVKQGIYTNNFNGSHAELTIDSSSDSRIPDCSKISDKRVQFSFKVKATVISSCVINAAPDIKLGNNIAGTTDITGNNNIAITCTKDMPYYIGLTPSNKNTNGAGVMSSTGSLDTISYQLRSKPGMTKNPWGNMTTNNGNAISDDGSGELESYIVYVTVPNTDVKPATYSDIVTVTVYY
ncbi:spore coat U domain-containing protein [Psychrobacter sp. GP33]|uniref:Csu type fimbrial protein n=1 Tax=Psychrobacter sp. GP33 TaxID=2758709 RepID=UPI0015F94219|nr:spore coat U domain-containing protein [Psychrobacter sp. GP33]